MSNVVIHNNLFHAPKVLWLAMLAVTANTNAADDALRLEEITVTAQKRAESLQNVPIAVSALDANALEQSGFDGVEDLSFMVPSLQFGNFGPSTFLNIRGIGSENTTGGSDPGVAFHVDGVYVGRPVGALFSAFDSERVEVLRGPQGTLYGRNAISDSIRARVVGFTEDRDGFTENTAPGGTDANDIDNYGVRAHLEFDLGDSDGRRGGGAVFSRDPIAVERRIPVLVDTGFLILQRRSRALLGPHWAALRQVGEYLRVCTDVPYWWRH